jgi:hypothetical protein
MEPIYLASIKFDKEDKQIYLEFAQDLDLDLIKEFSSLQALYKGILVHNFLDQQITNRNSYYPIKYGFLIIYSPVWNGVKLVEKCLQILVDGGFDIDSIQLVGFDNFSRTKKDLENLLSIQTKRSRLSSERMNRLLFAIYDHTDLNISIVTGGFVWQWESKKISKTSRIFDSEEQALIDWIRYVCKDYEEMLDILKDSDLLKDTELGMRLADIQITY